MDLNDHKNKQDPNRRTGYSGLDQCLCCQISGRGKVIEVRADESQNLFRFTLQWLMAECPSDRQVLVADPFDEIDPALMTSIGLEPERTLILKENFPQRLSKIILRLLDEGHVGGVLLPPGLVGQRFLDGGIHLQRRNKNLDHERFLSALRALTWSAKRNESTLFVCRKLPKGQWVSPFGTSQLRLQLLKAKLEGEWRVWVKHNAFNPNTVGKTLISDYVCPKTRKNDAGC